ncbi:DUF6049 family protein [Streptomyces sp. NPDC059740]|uniref:DUF6049 family protein n=1 Tax=Streptomyces sp. NPDC059740 TaxID=3346926 RepID=UPI00365F96DA
MAEAAGFQATERPRRRWLHSAVAALVAVPVLATAWQLPQAPAARAETTGSQPVDIAINSVSPSAPTKDGKVTVSGTVTNDTTASLSSLQVGLRRGAEITSRSALAHAAGRGGFSPQAVGQEVKGHEQEIGTLGAGAHQPFTLEVPAKDLHLGRDGVYELGVSLTGRKPRTTYDQVLGTQTTFLPWKTSDAAKKTQLTYLWPLISTTHLTAETDANLTQTPVFRDDELAKEIAPGGRLQQMVSLAKKLPVTLVIDPDLLASVDAMRKDYKVETGHGTVEGKHQKVANEWLDDVEGLAKSHEVVALPFADPDLASLAHHGRNVPSALGHLGAATDLANTTVDTVLHVKPKTDFAWPVDGAVDPSIVDVATSAGAHNVIARSDSMRESTSLPYTPTAARPIGGGTTAVVADDTLSTAFEGDMSTKEAISRASQDFAAQTLLISLQDPARQRSIVVAPSRTPSTDQAKAMAAGLKALSGDRWTEALSLEDASKASPDPSATRHVPGRRSYPASLSRSELPTEAFQDIQSIQSSVTAFKAVLSSPERVETPFGNAMMRAMSTQWRGDPEGATRFRASVRDYLNGLTHKVSLIQKSNATLSGRSATIPVTVQNNLVQDVKGLRLVMKSSQPNRLDTGKSQVITVTGGHSQSFKFDTTAHANGPVRVTARLYTADGKPYGRPMNFVVNVTEITSAVMLVIAGGVLLLVLAGVRIYLKRKRRGADEGPGDDGNGGADEGPAHPSDPTPDTGSRTTDGPGPGEKVDR